MPADVTVDAMTPLTHATIVAGDKFYVSQSAGPHDRSITFAELQATFGVVTSVADVAHTLSASDDIVTYTSLSSERTVTVNPAILTLNKIYTVRDGSGNIADPVTGSATGFLIRVTKDGMTLVFNKISDTILLNNNYASTSFYTPDGVNLVCVDLYPNFSFSNIGGQSYTGGILNIGALAGTLKGITQFIPGGIPSFSDINQALFFSVIDGAAFGFYVCNSGIFTGAPAGGNFPVLDINAASLVNCTSIVNASQKEVIALAAGVAVNGQLSLAGQPTDTFSGTMTIDVTKSSHVIAANHSTSATVTFTPSAAGTKGDFLEIITEASNGTVTATFASTFHPVTATQATTTGAFSTIAFRSDGVRWIELRRTTSVA
jgi:hypothetical protein